MTLIIVGLAFGMAGLVSLLVLAIWRDRTTARLGDTQRHGK